MPNRPLDTRHPTVALITDLWAEITALRAENRDLRERVARQAGVPQPSR